MESSRDVSREIRQSRIADMRDLYRIKSVQKSLAGSGNLSRLGREWLSFIVALVRCNYTGVYVSIGALSHAQWLAVGGAHSKRSTFRALSELENAGFLKREKFRIGNDKFKTKIHFDIDRFKFWMMDENKPKLIYHTPEHKDSQVPSWQEDAFTSNTDKLHSTKNKGMVSNKHKSKNNANKKKKHRDDPRVYTIRHVLYEDKARDWPAIIAKAELAVKESALGVDLEKWISMTFDERENFARSEIIPALRSKKSNDSKNCAEKLNSLISGIASEHVENVRDWYDFVRYETRNIETNMDCDEMAILLAAKYKNQSMKNI